MKFMTRALLAVPLLALSTRSGITQPDMVAKVDEFVREEMERQKVPGVAVAIIRGGNVAVAKGYGLANLEHEVPVSDQTLFQSGSVGKQFTAAAVMLLVEAGKLGLDESVATYLPDAPADWAPITVRHLLTHTSGIPDYTTEAFDLRRDYSEDDLAKMAYGLKLEFPPGSPWNYSNTGYVLLGIISGRVSGRFYADLLRDQVFDPLGMTTAQVISEEDILPNRAAGYRLVGEQLKNQEWVAPKLNTTADGSLYLSLQDLIAWDRGGSLSSRYGRSSRPIRSGPKPGTLYSVAWPPRRTPSQPSVSSSHARRPDARSRDMPRTGLILYTSLSAIGLAFPCERQDGRTAYEATETSADSISPAVADTDTARVVEDTTGQSFSYGCGDEYRFVAQMTEGGGFARLLLPDTTVTLLREVTASGARYGEGPYSYWSKGDEALLETPAASFTDCVSDEGGRGWQEAKTRGVRFRAIGQEPGWVLDIHEGDSITVLADYGESRYRFTSVEPEADASAGRTVYRVETDANRASIVIQEVPCRDVMSGWPYEATVSMTLDSREYRGCGRWL